MIPFVVTVHSSACGVTTSCYHCVTTKGGFKLLCLSSRKDRGFMFKVNSYSNVQGYYKTGVFIYFFGFCPKFKIGDKISIADDL